MPKDNQPTLPNELIDLIKQLVSQKHIRIAGTVLYVYFCRVWKTNDNLAAYYVTRYFQKYFPTQLDKHKRQH